MNMWLFMNEGMNISIKMQFFCFVLFLRNNSYAEICLFTELKQQTAIYSNA